MSDQPIANVRTQITTTTSKWRLTNSRTAFTRETQLPVGIKPNPAPRIDLPGPNGQFPLGPIDWGPRALRIAINVEGAATCLRPVTEGLDADSAATTGPVGIGAAAPEGGRH
jgi:hypothetical protein